MEGKDKGQALGVIQHELTYLHLLNGAKKFVTFLGEIANVKCFAS